jgi:hypothetical protein
MSFLMCYASALFIISFKFPANYQGSALIALLHSERIGNQSRKSESNGRKKIMIFSVNL